MKSKILIEKALNRQKSFFKNEKNGLLVFVNPKNSLEPLPLKRIDSLDWKSESSMKEYAESFFKARISEWQVTENIADDFIPSLQVLCGTGAIAASFLKNPKIHHEKHTNYLEPVLRSSEDSFGEIGFDPDNIYFKAHICILEKFIEEAEKNNVYPAICPFSYFDPLDLANQLRGNDLMLDFYDESNLPRLHKLLDLCTESIMEMEDYIRCNFLKNYQFQERVVGGCLLSGGTYLSCDIGDMIGPDLLKQFGFPYTERIIRKWGGAFLHHHELGIHQINTWSESDTLCVQFLNRDPNTPHLAQIFDDDIMQESLKVPIAFIAESAEFKKYSALWSQGKCIVRVNCNSVEEALKLITEKN